MKILVIGLDSAAPEILFADERLGNFRRLMEEGCYGRLETIIPPITVPAWMCMATSQDPGSLGVYGFRNRADHSYDGLSIANARSIRELAVWDQVAREGKRANIIAVPPGFPPRRVNGISVGCFLTPNTATDEYTRPPSVKAKIEELVGNYAVDVKGFRTEKKDWLKDEIYGMTRNHFDVIRYFLQHSEWDYFQFVEIGLDRLQHGFWKFHDPNHVLHAAGNPYEEVIRDYYVYLDDELARILNVLDEDTAILVLSDHGSQRLDGGFCVNEWLVREGLLTLERYPERVTPFSGLAVDWSRTKVWSEGGYYARVFFNVKGREPNGTIDAGDYERFRDEVKARFEAVTDDQGRPMRTLVFKPQEIYRNVRNVAPDLIVHFGELYWRSIGGVGYPTLHVQENDTGPDDCNHAQQGSFIFAAPGSPLRGEMTGAHILQMAPTLLEVGGFDVPTTMQGTSLLAGRALGARETPAVDPEGEAIIRERLSGLGYIS
jgi:predicted AlkP superfamily phosphohydrolase/phosphomutase